MTDRNADFVGYVIAIATSTLLRTILPKCVA